MIDPRTDARIDRVTITLDAFNDRAGRIASTFDIPLTEVAFIAAVRLQWAKHLDALEQQTTLAGNSNPLDLFG